MVKRSILNHQVLRFITKSFPPMGRLIIQNRHKRYKFPSISFLPILQGRARSRQAIVVGDFVIRGTDCNHK